jgi:hypothetical protein
MAKYTALGAFLRNTKASEVPMTFEEVSRIVGADLPPSAYRHRPWWANEAAGHVHAQSWLDAGFEATRVDMAGQKLVFKRMADDSPRYAMHGFADSPREFEPAENNPPRRHPAFGALKGLLWIEPGYDLTQPAIDEDWEEAFDKKWDGLLK